MKLDQFFTDEGYTAIADPSHGVPSLGINQIYLKDDDQFVMVKYGIVGEFPLDEWIQTPTGNLIHQKTGDNQYFLYFRGIGEVSARLLVNRMKEKISSYKIPSFKSLLIPEAHADEDCVVTSQVVANLTDFTNVSARVIYNFARSCIPGLGAGVYGSTVGTVNAIGQGIWDAVTDPVGTVEGVGRTVHNFTVGLGRFIRGLVTDPHGTLSRAGRSIGGAWSGMVGTVAAMSNELKIQFICSLLASLGVDAAIAFITAGAASGQVAIRLATMARKMTLLTRVFGILSRLGNSALTRIGMTAEKTKILMNRVMRGDLHDDDLRHFDDLARADGNLSVGALACFI